MGVVTWIWITHPSENISPYIEAYKAIGSGFLVALFGTIIPNLILESRDNFERAKESRIAYSQAKTSVIYLPGTLAVLEYGEAMAALQEVHRKLHIAETYGKELDEYLAWYGDKATWTDQTYWELTIVRELLQSHADQWNDKSTGERTVMVDRALATIRDLFGTKGKKWKNLVEGENLTEEERERRADRVVATVCSSDADRRMDRDRPDQRENARSSL